MDLDTFINMQSRQNVSKYLKNFILDIFLRLHSSEARKFVENENFLKLLALFLNEC